MQCKAIVKESGYYYKVVKKVMEELDNYMNEGWKPQGGIDVTYNTDTEEFGATLLIIKEEDK